MSVKINFDTSGNPEIPTCILSKRNGEHIGVLNTINKIHFSDDLYISEFSFCVHKILNGIKCGFWDEIRDFRLVYIPIWGKWFEIYVEISEGNECIKLVTATSLCESELSNIRLFDIEINTEADIARSDYVPTVLYNQNSIKASLLNRLIRDKAPHYKIVHVDDSISNIQRTFSFNNKSIYDSFQEIAEEIHCLFVFNIEINSGKMNRTISVYDLENYCNDCGYREEFIEVCPKCNSKNILNGYGEDTTIFVSSENLSDEITYETDVDSVKNCFKLESGDSDMDAAIINCNPAGTSYLQYINNETKEDMSTELVDKLDSYDNNVEYYKNDFVFNIDEALILKYNQLINKYKVFSEDLQTIITPILGYQELMKIYYDTIDFGGYLKNTLMPSVKLSETTAKLQVALLTTTNLSPVSIENIKYISLATANSTVLSYAKVYIDTSKYKININSSSISGTIWTGNFIVTNYSDEDDIAISNTIKITFNDDYENFIKQKIDKLLSKDNYDLSIVGLFEKDLNDFKLELQKYSLTYLQLFHDACQSCLDILIEQGISDNSSQTDLYNSIYKPYFNKLESISQELQLREREINIILGEFDSKGNIIKDGLQTIINKYRNSVASELDFKKYIGDYWDEFCSFRNEDLWKNDNYISDGLNNAQLFKRAKEFLNEAKKDLIRSATLQHSISASLKNLLIIDDFKPIVDHFAIGNWIRLLVDDKIYKLRLIHYEIDYNSLESLSVTFSDVVQELGSISDIKSILQQSKSIASSYSSIKHQAEKIEKNDNVLNDWLEKGFDATTTKIVNNADNQNVLYDEHGMLFREYDSETNTYSPTQLKIINSTLAVTKDAWETASTGIGKFIYFDPKDNEYKTGYGVIADTIVGNIILGKTVGIYNETGNMVFDEHGLEITNGSNHFKVNPNSDKMLSVQYDDSEVLSVSKESAKISGFHMNENAIYSGADSITSKTKGIYIGKDGVNITDGKKSFQVNPSSDTILSISNQTEPIFYVDKNGKLHIKGDGAGLDISANSTISGLSSRITQNANGIQLKVDKDGIVSSINQSNEVITINANKINLNGIVTANQYFKILPNGSMEAKNGVFSGELEFSNAEIDKMGVFYSWDDSKECILKVGRAAIEMYKNGSRTFAVIDSQYGTSIAMYDISSKLALLFNTIEKNFIIKGNLEVSGTKNRIADTENYSQRLLYCYEMAAPIFGDIGEGTIDETGSCCIFLDDIFSETIAFDMEYQVFLQKEGPGDVWVDSKKSAFFIVKGTPGLKFAWEIKAKQKEYGCERLEKFEHTPEKQTDESHHEVDTINELELLIKEREELLYETT